ncbi:putative protein isoform X1 [Capsicum chacoense]
MQEILYEKEGYLCTSCGRFGHVHKDCSHRQHPPPVDASSSAPCDIPNVPRPPQQKWQTVKFSARRKNRTQGKSSTPDLETQSNTPIHQDTVKVHSQSAPTNPIPVNVEENGESSGAA